MRVLVVHPGVAYSVSDVYRGWVRGLTDAGCEVRTYNLDERLEFFERAIIVEHHDLKVGDAVPTESKILKRLTPEEACRAASENILATAFKWWPELVVVICATFTPPDVLQSLRNRGMKVVCVFTESPYEDDRQIGQAPFCDVALINDFVTLEQWREVNPRTYYGPHAYDPTIHHPGPSDHKSDVCFVGTGFGARGEFIDRVDWDGIDLWLGGGMWQTEKDQTLAGLVVDNELVDNERTADIYRGSKVGFNLYRQDANSPDLVHGGAIGPREVEMAACGLFFARDPRPENEELWPFLPSFTDPRELGDIIRRYLNRPAERAELAERARLAIADRTFEQHARKLLSIL